MHRISYKLLLLFTVTASIGGIITLIPRAAASYPNILGYSSVCTFAPAASFFCFGIAGVICFLRSAFIKDQSGSSADRFKRHLKFIIPPLLLLAAAFISTGFFISIKSQYTDTQTSATAMEEQ